MTLTAKQKLQTREGKATPCTAAVMLSLAIVFSLSVARTVCVHLAAQTTGLTAGTATASSTPWGEPDLSGLWAGAGLVVSPGHDTFNLTELERLYRPEALVKMRQLSEKNDPALRCIPYTFPRAITLARPFQVIQAPGLVTVLIESMHTFRIIPTDGRQHPRPEVLFPTFHGDSVGHWEGNTLVVDVVSVKGETWLADGRAKPTPTSTGAWFTSDERHMVERWRRIDAGTLEYQATIEDPEVLTGPWTTPKVTVVRASVDRIEEANECMDSQK